jgi:hypothetical protein
MHFKKIVVGRAILKTFLNSSWKNTQEKQSSFHVQKLFSSVIVIKIIITNPVQIILPNSSTAS